MIRLDGFKAASKAAGVYQLEALLSAACTQDLRLQAGGVFFPDRCFQACRGGFPCPKRQAFQMPVRRPSRAAEKVYVVGWETYLRGAELRLLKGMHSPPDPLSKFCKW